MKIAIVQMPMAWTLEENVQTVLASLTKAKSLGADVVVFPENSVVSFHAGMREGVTHASISEVVNKLNVHCASLEIAALIGMPYFGSPTQERPWNAIVVFDKSGKIVEVCPKILFMPAETHYGFFEPGHSGSRRAFQVGSVLCTVLVCCEWGGGDGVMPNHHEILNRLSERPQVLFIPGFIDMNDGALYKAAALAREFEAFVVVANWPDCRAPDLIPPGVCLGRSMAFAPDGEILCEAPPNRPAIVVAALPLSL